MGPLPPGGAPSAMSPLGSLREVRARLAEYNTSPDGAPPRTHGTEFLYGPGFSIEIATSSEPVMQGIITVTEDDIAMPVLFRLVRTLKWRMMDMESGRVFGE